MLSPAILFIVLFVLVSYGSEARADLLPFDPKDREKHVRPLPPQESQPAKNPAKQTKDKTPKQSKKAGDK